ncbi:hypothetical protein [Dyella sp. 2HG41-7]|uniref:hypothetical protein n=1 Tax=Dyella sp. 2HG41-7 TaxID=2883239 RepID=UPI001F28E6ED|nr:hypothetical protein [Dyella sp. 2HG41-7]
MIRKPLGFALRTVAATALMTAMLATPAMAHQAVVTGLGQAWPNAADVSVSPHYHVYVFVRDGIRYFQINDANGTVRAAVAVADNVVLVLPIGVDAGNVSTLHGNGLSATLDNAQTVYSDTTTRITVTPTATGASQVNVITPADSSDTGTCTDPFNCTGQVVRQPSH